MVGQAEKRRTDPALHRRRTQREPDRMSDTHPPVAAADMADVEGSSSPFACGSCQDDVGPPLPSPCTSWPCDL